VVRRGGGQARRLEQGRAAARRARRSRAGRRRALSERREDVARLARARDDRGQRRDGRGAVDERGRLGLEAVVQQHDRARRELLERRLRDARRVELAVVPAIGPEHHLQAAALEHAAQRQAAHAERRPEPDGPRARDLLEDVLGAVDLGGHRLAAREIEVRMRPRVVADLVALVADAAHEVGIRQRVRAAQEEGRADLVRAQDVEDLTGVRLGRAVVEGEQDLGRVGAADRRGREQRGARRAEPVGEHRDGGEAEEQRGREDFETRILHQEPSYCIYNSAMRKARPVLDTVREDWIHLVLAPVWALALGLALAWSPLTRWKVSAFGLSGSPVDAFLGAFIMAHLVIVFFRSHGNAEVRARHPVRFWLVPPALLLALVFSAPALTAAAALAIWWDVYHSSLQTFGIGRIFDRNADNDPEAGRSLDLILSLLLYAGPILCGSMLLFHAQPLYSLEAGPWVEAIVRFQPRMRPFIVGAGLLFLVLYIVNYAALISKGYRPPREKVALQLGTAAVSVWAWGFNPLGMALFIMNFFHAWQYFFLVRRYERVPLALLAGAGFLYGAVFGVLGDLSDKALAVTLVVSLMHFWYDGFVWSVRKAHA